VTASPEGFEEPRQQAKTGSTVVLWQECRRAPARRARASLSPLSHPGRLPGLDEYERHDEWSHRVSFRVTAM